jgi:hypothetical protein
VKSAVSIHRDGDIKTLIQNSRHENISGIIRQKAEIGLDLGFGSFSMPSLRSVQRVAAPTNS